NWSTEEDSQSVLQAKGQGGVRKAIEDLEEAAAELPGRPDVPYQIARAWLFLGRPDEAGRAVDRSLKCASDFVPALVLKASILEDGGDLEGAAQISRRVKSTVTGSWGEAWLVAQRTGKEWNPEKQLEAYTRLVTIERETREPY